MIGLFVLLPTAISAETEDPEQLAIELIQREYDLLVRISDPQPVSDALVDELIEVDEAGVELLALRTWTPAVTDVLGPLPRTPSGTAEKVPPPPAHLYQRALGELGVGELVPPAASAARVVPRVAGAQVSGSGPPWALIAVALGLAGALAGIIWGRHHMRRNLGSLADTDGLTGLANRRRLEHDLDELESMAHRVSLLMIDVDRFKEFNDDNGHLGGDAVLRRVSASLSSAVADQGVAYRFGGDEFCLVLPNVDEVNAREVATRIRAAVGDGAGGTVTLSIGIATGSAPDVRHLLAAADHALLDAKRTGRDRVSVASKPTTAQRVP